MSNQNEQLFFGGFKVGDLESGSMEYFYLTSEDAEECFYAEGALGFRADSTVMVENFCYILGDDDLIDEPREHVFPGDFDWLKD